MADENEPAIEELDDGWTPRELQDALPVAAQRVLHGDPFHRGLPIQHGKSEERVPQKRRVGVVAGLDEVDNDFFIAEDEAPNITPSDFPDAPLAQAGKLFDRAEEGPRSLQTVRKEGASTVFMDTDAVIKDRGGDPNHRIEKPNESFAYTPGS